MKSESIPIVEKIFDDCINHCQDLFKKRKDWKFILKKLNY